jgi:non-heme chloroperoxidase
VIAIDQRGRGESAKPGFGNKIHRLSKDLRELIIALDFTEVTVLGYSMGCSVIWGYWELFGVDRLAKIILVDEPPHLTANPARTPAEKEAAGALLIRPNPPMTHAIPWQDPTAKRLPARSSAVC